MFNSTYDELKEGKKVFAFLLWEQVVDLSSLPLGLNVGLVIF